MPNKLHFSQKHPFCFGFLLITAAVILLVGVMAALRFWAFGDSGRNPLLRSPGRKLGLVRIEGIIANPERITRWISDLREDSSVLGVLLRINSPGGAVAPSQEIYRSVKRLADVKPVVASMGAVAASGGYYAAAPAHTIMANPATITASIGVIMELSNIQGLFEKLGLKQESLTSGKLKDAGSPFRPMTPEERKYLQGLVMDLHRQFVADVAAARNMDLSEVQALADGRAMTGQQALEAGLVDKLGGLEEAVDLLKSMCGVKGKIAVVEGPETKTSLLWELLGMFDLNPGSRNPGPLWRFQY